MYRWPVHRTAHCTQSDCFATEALDALPEGVCVQGGQIAALLLGGGKYAVTSRVLKVRAKFTRLGL